MSFFSGNTFSGGGYSCARHDTALVKGIEMSADQAALALAEAISECDAVMIGAGAGLSTAAGLTYSGGRFDANFADFRDAYGITDMYSGGFYPFLDSRPIGHGGAAISISIAMMWNPASPISTC